MNLPLALLFWVVSSALKCRPPLAIMYERDVPPFQGKFWENAPLCFRKIGNLQWNPKWHNILRRWVLSYLYLARHQNRHLAVHAAFFSNNAISRPRWGVFPNNLSESP